MLFITALVFAQATDLSKVAVIHDDGNWIKFLPDSRIEVDDFFATYAVDLGLGTQYQFELVDSWQDKMGMDHFKYQIHFAGHAIEGSEYILHVSDGFITAANGQLVKELNLSNTSSFTEEQGLEIAKTSTGADMFYWEMPEMEARIKLIKDDPNATFFPSGELVYIHPKLESAGTEYMLAWKYDIIAPHPVDRQMVYVNANTGDVILTLDGCHETSTEGEAVTRYHGTRSIVTDSISPTEYRLHDMTRGGGIMTYDMNEETDNDLAVDFMDEDNFWGNANEEMDEVAGDVHWGMEQTYDYFLNDHELDSYDGNGAPIISYVHYDSDWMNATFNGYWARFGDGNNNPLTSIDIVAHELTHGVTWFSAGLMYQDEPGALNESFSDIFGTAVEHYSIGEDADWIMGTANFAFRNMADPNSNGNPDTYLGTFWVAGNQDYGGVHSNSGVQNFWFYLLSEGGSGTNDNGDAYEVESIGMDKASAISFRNLSTYLTSLSGYHDARFGSIQAAEDLYGTCSNEVLQVAAAWHAVGVGEAEIGDDIQMLEVLSPSNTGCELGSSEIVSIQVRYNPSGCGDVLESGQTFEVSYQIDEEDPVFETVELIEDLNGGDLLIYNFQTFADLSEVGRYEMAFDVNLDGDGFPENDQVDNIKLTKSLIIDDSQTIAFQVFPAIYDSFYVETNAHSAAAVSVSAANTGIAGFKLEGVGADLWAAELPTTEEENFTANPESISKLCFCVDATLWDAAYLSFDLRQQYSAYSELVWGGDMPEAIALRVTANDNQIGNQFHPSTYDSDPYLTHILDLNEYAGTAFNLCFEGVHFLNSSEDIWPDSPGDASQLDNIFLSQNEILGVEQFKTIKANIYPNPTSGTVLIQLDAIGLQNVSVIDLLGNELQTENWNATGSQLELDLSSLASGVYFISIQSETVNVVQKIVLE